jgi:Mrp family chromosome partitioning ATPase
MSELMETVRERYDFVVLDAPPGPVMSDILPLMSYVNGVVIVGSLRHASRRAAAELRSQLELANAQVLGVIANNAKHGREGYYAKKRSSNAPANGAAAKGPYAHHR